MHTSILRKLLCLVLLSTSVIQAFAQESAPAKNRLGAGYKYFMLNEKAQNYYSSFQGISAEYSRFAFNSYKWWLVWELYYSRAQGIKDGNTSVNFEYLALSPGVEFDIWPFLGLALKADIILTDRYDCYQNGKRCDGETYLYMRDRLPRGIRGSVGIPIRIPLSGPFRMRILPAYYLPPFEYSRNLETNDFAVTCLLSYEL